MSELNINNGEPGEIQATIGTVLGEIAWLLSQSTRHRNSLFIADLEWAVMPAILNGQYRLFRGGGKPLGVALWAFISPEVEARLQQGYSKLKPDEWRSGPQAWLMDLIAPFGHADKLLEELKKTSLRDYRFKCHQITADGDRTVVNMAGERVIDDANA